MPLGMRIKVQVTSIIEGPEVQLAALCMALSAASTSSIIQDALCQSGKIKQKVDYPSEVG